MYKLASLPLLFAAAAIAAPEPLLARNGGINCAAFNTIVSIMHEQAVATPFCSSYLHIPRPTTTTTVTSSPPAVTTTTTVTSTDTVTTTSVSTYSTVTTVYPVVAVSTTSTCALSATVVQSKNQKRDPATTPCTTTSIPAYSDPPLGTPLVLTKFVQTDVSSACSCLNIPTQTYTSTVSTTAKPSTITSTVCNEAYTTVTVTSTTTTFTSTYSGTQYYTSTFTVLPPPSSTIVASAYPTETFGAYQSLDFSGQDIQNFFCYQGGAPPPSPFTGTNCTSFTDCVNECAYYNAKGYGASSNTTCGAVVYNAPADGSSGSCYLKTGVQGCGGTNAMTNTGVLLPLVATDPQ